MFHVKHFKRAGGWQRKETMMNFKEWCALDINDTRKINYEILIDGKVEHLTSEDTVTPSLMLFVQNANIEFIKLFNNEWYVILR